MEAIRWPFVLTTIYLQMYRRKPCPPAIALFNICGNAMEPGGFGGNAAWILRLSYGVFPHEVPPIHTFRCLN